ncbi:MAG: ABC transporter ATP-binding protein [Planctomycetes bacterium]|nr:ABC transporter ATP-binding protein [Planctomycetota bacterium]MCB9891119.1 ABC transporter ATP-binding protein [Planctomycetota bacterium]MCB9918887.1 ABC transporter ATP-binding protein [Planctomycetota bacterium]
MNHLPDGPSDPIIAKGLTKRFGDRVAVDDLSFSARAGETFGLLGPNGAGKSTTIRMLVGALKPDDGSIEIAGKTDPTRAEVKRALGYVPQEIALYDELSAEENLAFFARLHELKGKRLSDRIDFALDFAGLNDRRKDRVATFSGGMKRRLNLVTALMHEPRALFLDEPTVGVDPQSRAHIFENIETLRANGTTILYTTHEMEAAERLCDRIAILDHGRLMARDTVDALLQAHGTKTRVAIDLRQLPSQAVVETLPGELTGTTLRIEADDPFVMIGELRRFELDVARIQVERANLETVFLDLTGRRLRDT